MAMAGMSSFTGVCPAEPVATGDSSRLRQYKAHSKRSVTVAHAKRQAKKRRNIKKRAK